MAEGSVVWVDVLPSMRGFGAQLAKDAAGAGTRAGRQVGAELEAAATDAGRRAGQSMGVGLEAAKARAEKLGQALGAARDKEADAAGRVRVAEQRLEEVRNSGNAKVSQIATAEERLATAKRGLSTATERTSQASKAFEKAQADSADATDSVTLSLDRAESGVGGFGSSLGSIAKTAGGFAAGVLAIGGAADTAAQYLENAQLGSKLAAQLGATAPMSQELGRIAGSLYSQAYGDSLGQVNEAIRGVMQSGLVMEDASSAQIEAITGKVLNLASAFELDLGEATQAVGQLLKTGLAPDAETALDIVTRGFQQGADRSKDFLDTLTEYSVQFAKFGLDAQTATGLLVQGMQAGARNSDLVADAIKEFSIRAVDGSKTTADGFKAIGLNAADMAAQIARGGPEASAGLDLVMERLRGMKDPVAQSQAAVALFGTQAEDLGQALFALDPSEATKRLGVLGGAADQMGATLRDNAGTKVEEFKRSIQTGLVDVLGNQVIPTVQGFVGWIRDNSAWLTPLVIGLGSFAAVLGIVNGAMTLWAARTAIAAGAQWALNAALLANPIVAIVAAVIALGAVIVYAYNNIGWFRDGVNAAWAAIKTGVQAVGDFFVWLWQSVIVPAWNGIVSAAQWAWNNVLSPVFDAISFGVRLLAAILFTALVTPFVIGWNALAAAAQWAWENVLKPAWDAIAVAAQWLWANVLSPVFGWIAAGWGLLLDGINWAWQNILKPAWDAISAAANWLWTNVLMPVFGWIAAGWSAQINAMSWAWNNILRPAWDAISAAAQWLWNNILRPVFDAIGIGWRALMDGLNWVWQNILKPVFDAIGWALDLVGQAFDRTATWVRDTWDKIKEYARAPIQFVIDVVYNNGIRPVWNGIAGVFGLGKLDEVRLAGGGVLPGYAPGVDSIPAMLSPGEAVLTPEATRAIGPGNILALNAALSGRKPGSTGGHGVAHFAGGGIVDGLAAVAGWIPGVGGAIRTLRDFLAGGGQGGGMWRDLTLSIPRKAVEAITEWFKSDSGGYGAVPVANVGGGVQRWSGLVLQALAMLGQPAEYLGITLRRMQQESGGNPNIGNYWDINAKRGTPSMGLMQVIGPTFARYRDPRAANNILDPLANILASMRYALARYGSLPAAYNRPGGYDEGGLLPPGDSLVWNRTGRPEPVLTAEQWDTVRRYLPTEGGGAQPIEVHVHPRAEQSEQSIAAMVRRELALAMRSRG